MEAIQAKHTTYVVKKSAEVGPVCDLIFTALNLSMTLILVLI